MPPPALCRLLLGAALLAAPLPACSSSVPADPGRNARLRQRPDAAPEGSEAAGATAPSARADADPAAGALYAGRCGQCHEPFAPATFHAGEWPTYVDRYAPRAGLFGQERQRVLRWLQANAR